MNPDRQSEDRLSAIFQALFVRSGLGIGLGLPSLQVPAVPAVGGVALRSELAPFQSLCFP